MLGSKHSCKMRGALVVGTRKMSWLEFINSKKSVQFLVQAVLLCKKRSRTRQALPGLLQIRQWSKLFIRSLKDKHVATVCPFLH